jgi:hypothetical protein
MPVMVVGNEATLAGLENRLFKSGLSAAAAERLRKAIRDENPGVNFNELRPGTVLKLPRSPDLRSGRDLSLDDSVRGGVDAMRDHLKADLEELGTAAQNRLRDDAANRIVIAKELASREVQAAAAQDDTVMAALNSASEGIAEDAVADEQRLNVIGRAIGEWIEELAAFDAMLR